jgi:Na+-transporting NADH:ubiquinone oxidoreductase subunit A
MGTFTLKQTFNIRLEGRSEDYIISAPFPEEVAVKPGDFRGFKTKLLVAEGDKVKAGTPLVYHKENENITLTSPASGVVKEIRRGERRVIEEIVIATDKKQSYQKISLPKKKIEDMTGEEVKKVILKSGLFPAIIQRPFGTIANPEDTPRDIFISAMDTAPLAARMALLMDCNDPSYQTGIHVLERLTSGNVHVSVNGRFPDVCPGILHAKGCIVHKFNGRHPAGNVGVQIHHIAPIRGRNDIVWTISVQGVILLGRLFLEGKYNAETVVAVAGTSAEQRCYHRTIIGAAVDSFVGKVVNCPNRFISGNVLTGKKITQKGYMGFFNNLLMIIPEPRGVQFLGWARFGLNKRSFSRTYFSSFFKYTGRFREEAAANGSLRAFVATGMHENVLPMDIFPVFLMKSIIAGDIDEMEKLGIYEVIEEDLALVEYVDPSKNEFQTLLRRGLDLIEKEG